ncbi:amidohydrolase [Fimicolochytrium jonesii]|uniref:amidohydrolase n=1 Tax=Fimicolochytrium jonesii TaxID=1396493 RepID=UPI0022FF1E13|nr:amidohydrolase [Fimicolochytrium jonesii]KAI8823990.1 amidohydrolase [Fimicolochytrium jonesii]
MTDTKKAPMKVAVTNARIFDGHHLSNEPTTVVLEGGLIVSVGNSPNALSSTTPTINAQGSVLLPGYIDSHVHVHTVEELDMYRRCGVTTVLDMATQYSEIKALREAAVERGTTDVRGASTPATVADSMHCRRMGVPALVKSAADAAGFVEGRRAEGADYIKIIADVPGPDVATIRGIVDAAHANGLSTVAHAATYEPFQMAIEANVDIITHVPLDQPIDLQLSSVMKQRCRAAVPTLAMMEQIKFPGASYDFSRESVASLHAAGVPILVGTDANQEPVAPLRPVPGESFHRELELLVEAGLTPLDALRGATSLAALHFGLDDRGSVREGLRADLVLVDGDPTRDIQASRLVRRVWCAGIEYDPSSA